MFNETSYLGTTVTAFDCGQGRVRQGNVCVCTPSSPWWNTNQCVSGPVGYVPVAPPNPNAPADYAACLAYVEKYKRLYGVDPVGIRCMRPPAPPVDVYHPPSPPPVSPVHRIHVRRFPRRYHVRRPIVEHPVTGKPVPSPATGELCPIRGYVSRPIPGVPEYQNFKCTPGQPVVIDPGLQAVGAAEARLRHPELSGLGDLGFLVGNIEVPTWLPVVAVGVIAIMFLGKRRR